MLSILLGNINNLSLKSSPNTVKLPESSSTIAFKNGVLSQYSKYKPMLLIEDNEYIISITGHAKWRNSPISDETQLQTVLTSYQQHGPSMLEQLSGQFYLIIINKTESSCLIANDIMATFPVYYTQTDANSFHFANKLSLLLDDLAERPELNHQAIYDYVYFHMIPSPETIYKGVFKLEPGQFLLFNKDQYEVKNYWQPEFPEQDNVSKEEFAQQIFDTLDSSVKSFIKDEAKTGAFLSGGLDSSVIAGLLAKNSQHQANTFSIGFPVKEYNEIEYARTAVNHFQTRQHEYFIEPEDIPSVIQNIISYMDEPFGNSSVIPAYYCAKMAKEQGVEHLLAGDGGDELFAGNTRYAKQKTFEKYFLIPEFVRKKFIEPVFSQAWIKKTSIGRKGSRYIEQANIALPFRLETYNFLHINTPESVFSDNFLSHVNTEEPEQLLDKVYHRPENTSYLNRMLFLDWKHTLADNDLRKVGSMCELAGVNVEYPMLSSDMVQLSARIPSNLKLTGTRLRYLYKYAMKDFLPESIINKPKHGFGLPFGIWTQTNPELQKLAYDAIDYLRTLNIFNDDFLDQTIKNHKEEHAIFYGELIWILMVLGLWLKTHNT